MKSPTRSEMGEHVKCPITFSPFSFFSFNMNHKCLTSRELLGVQYLHATTEEDSFEIAERHMFLFRHDRNSTTIASSRNKHSNIVILQLSSNIAIIIRINRNSSSDGTLQSLFTMMARHETRSVRRTGSIMVRNKIRRKMLYTTTNSPITSLDIRGSFRL